MAMKKKRRTKARRRSNPVPVIFANPRKRRRRRRRSNPTRHPRSWLKSAAPKRRRRRRHAAPHARRRARFKRVGVRRYDRKRRKAVQFRKPYRRSRSGRMVRVRRLYRRSNPTSLKGIAGLIRPCLFGGLGVITARIGKHLYQKYAQSMVAGDGSSAVRGYLNEALGLASMALITIGVEKGLKKVPGVRSRRLHRVPLRWLRGDWPPAYRRGGEEGPPVHRSGQLGPERFAEQPVQRGR
jgi:hypothetical protein